MTTPGPPLGTDAETEVVAPPDRPLPVVPTVVPAPPRPRADPPSRTRARAARRSFRRRRLAVLGVVVVATIVLVFAGVAPVRDGLRRLVPSPRVGAPPAEAGSLLLAWPTADADGAVLVLLGAAQHSSRGSALLVPSRTQVEVPSFGSQTLGGAFRTAGADTVALALENALGYDVGRTLGLDAATLAAVLEPAAPLEVRLRRPVQIGDEVFPATPHGLTADQASRLVTTRAEGAADLDHLVVVHAVLEAWLARLDGDVLGLTEDRFVTAVGIDEGRASSIVAMLDALSRRDVIFDTLDVVPLGLPGEERYAIDEAEVGEEMAVLFPGLSFAVDGRRVRVEILNGTGRAGLATEAARRLVPAGAHVVLTGNAAEFGVEETLVVLQDARFEAEAQRLVDALGVGQLRMARSPVGVADVSIVIGADFDPGGG